MFTRERKPNGVAIYDLPYWQLLQVCLVDKNGGSVSKLVFSEGINTSTPNVRVASLSVTHELIEKLLPEKAWNVANTLIKSFHKSLNRDIMKQLDSESNFTYLKVLLNAAVQIQTAEIMWESHVNGTNLLEQIRRFVLGTPEEYMLSQLLRALQLVGLYWWWTEKTLRKLPGPLVVCFPKPHNQAQLEQGGLQPRLGFAALFINSEKNPVWLCQELIDQLQPVLDSASNDITTHRGDDVEKDVKSWGTALLGKEIFEQLRSKMSSLHLGGPVGANLVLQRVLPILHKLNELSPSFIHEGRQFTVNILIGLQYHEQVVGEHLGYVEDFLRDLERKVPDKSRKELGRCLWGTLELLGPLINCCYSLLDWERVVLFARFAPDKEKMVRFVSLHRLYENTKASTPSEIYQRITGQYAGLFAITIDRAKTIRVYYGGAFLLSKQKGEWKIGSVEDDLSKLIVKTICKIGIKVNSMSSSSAKPCLREFTRLLLRISEEPGVGAAFVIVKGKTYTRELSKIMSPPKGLWEKIRPFSEGCSEQDKQEKEIFYRLSTMDGATAIILGHGKTFEQRWKSSSVFPRLLMTGKFDIDSFWDEHWKKGGWADWFKFLSSGSRHNSGLALAMQAKINNWPLAVILVSADGPITFLVGGE